MTDLKQAQTHFVELMAELFQLDEAQALDFGIYRVIRHRNKAVRAFLGEVQTKGDDKTLVGGELQRILNTNFARKDEERSAELDARLSELEANFGLSAHLTAEQRDQKLTELHAIPAMRGSVDEYRTLREQRDAARYGDDDRLEVLNRLHQFFDRHYQDGDFIVQRRYGREGQRYIRSTGQDTEFRWATEDMYYIKSGDIFTDFPVRLANGAQIVFAVDADTLSATRAALKPNDKAHYQLKSAKKDGDAVRVLLEYAKGARTKAHDKAIVDAVVGKTGAQAEDVARWLRRYIARNQSDFFIHKRLGEALNEELDIFLKTDVLDADQLLAGHARAQRHTRVAQQVRAIGREIIAFLAALEDFQKQLWEKKKLVLETRYIITLDRIEQLAGREWLEERLPAIIKAQRKEWKALGLGDYAKPKDCLRGGGFLPLPVDTQNADMAFKWEFLGKIGAVDDSIDGVLFASENFHAANLMLEKFSGRAQAFYCDPPYNTDAGPISYKNGYKRSSWAALVYDRLLLAKRLTKPAGVHCWTIDDYQIHELVEIIDRAIGEDAIRGVVTIKNSPSGRPTVKGFRVAHEYAVFAAVSEQSQLGLIERSESQQAHFGEQDEVGPFAWENFRKRGGATTHRSARPKQFYPIYVSLDRVRIPKLDTKRDWVKAEQRWEVRDPIKKGEVELYPVNDDGTERVWSWGHETASKQVADLEVRWKDGLPSVFRKVRPQSEGSLPSTLWVKPEYSAVEYGSVLLKGMFGERGFSFPKSIHAVVDCLKVTGVEDGDWVVDLFGGSGTTAHAALRLIDDDIRCRFVLSEVNEYFEAGLLPRVVKAASAQEWEEGSASEIDGPGIFIRVQRLEGYEDTLENLALTPEQGESAALPFDDGPTALRWKLDEEARRVYCAIEHYRSPFGYTLRRAEGAGAAQVVPVDLVESLVWLLGLDVARMWREPEGVGITGTNRRGESVLVAFRECEVKGSGDWVMRLMAEHPAERMYTNDPADLAFPGVERLEAIEAVFASQFGAA